MVSKTISYGFDSRFSCMMYDFLGVFVSIIIAFGLASIMVAIPYIIGSPQTFDLEKLSAYECGFDPFDDARARFDIQFYLVAILFLIFDLEISFLFPWSITFGIQAANFWSMLIFLAILTVGFYYEWMKGALQWN